MPDPGNLKQTFEAEDEQELVLSLMLSVGMEGTSWPELIDAVGFDTAMKIVSYFEGRSFKVPRIETLVGSLNAAGASLAVYRKEMTVRAALRKFKVGESLIKQGVEVLAARKKALAAMRQRHARQKPPMQRSAPKS